MKEAILIIIGALISCGTTFFLDWIKSKREERIRIRQKREDIYLRFYRLVVTAYKVREEGLDLRDKNVIIPNYIELEAEMELYGSSKINSLLLKNMQKGKTVETHTKEDIEELIQELRTDLGIEN